MEEEHKSALTKVLAELEESRSCETKLHREMARKSSEITALKQQLEECKENLQYSWTKLESLGEQYEKTVEQQERITVRSVIYYLRFIYLFTPLFNNYPVKSRGISPDTKPTRLYADLAKIRGYSVRLSGIIGLLFNALIIKHSFIAEKL